MLVLLLAYALMAATFPLAWVVMQHAQPFFTIGFRMTIAGIFLLGYLLVRGQSIRFLRSDAKLFVYVILFHIFIAYISEFYGLTMVYGAMAALIYNLSPFITALVSYWVLKERLSFYKYLGLLIGFLGFLPIAYSQISSGAVLLRSFPFSWGELLILVSVISAVFGWMTVRKLVVERSYSPLHVNGIAMLGGGLLSLLCSLFETWSPIPTTQPAHFMIQIFSLMVLGNFIYYNLIAYLLRSYSPTFISFAGFVTPLFAAFYDWLFFGHVMGKEFYLASIFVSLGLYLFYSDELCSQK
ncbi:MAG TPA: DMT family transporter [Candidatus Babeliales bacterium]|nr:DMT family transporter [Candidatus Babeliales bacterium]